MTELADNSVNLVITSPPYWQLKDYGNPSQIGFNQSYSEYVDSLNLVWMECFRVLKSGCRVCINVGDQFAGAAYFMTSAFDASLRSTVLQREISNKFRGKRLCFTA